MKYDFEHYLRAGHGRAYLMAKEAPEKYRKAIMNACGMPIWISENWYKILFEILSIGIFLNTVCVFINGYVWIS